MEISRNGKKAYDIFQDLDSYFQFVTSETYKQTNFKNFGESQTSILRSLDQRLKKDTLYSSGKIIGAMTTTPHSFARFVYSEFIDRNLGDRGLNPGTSQIENEAISMIGGLLGNESALGNIVSGGTEANIIAMNLAKQSKPHIKNPNIVLPDSAHYSFNKAAILMGFEIRRAKLNPNYSLNLIHYENLIDQNTIALVGITGTSALGLIDPIKEIAKLARDYNIYFHVDGAFGGLILPFMEMLGYEYPPYNLNTPEICSFTVDPHKMGSAVNPCGAILINDTSLSQFGFKIPYLAGGGFKSFNLLGTRPGASAISFWALMQYLGKNGMKFIVESCWENTLYLRNKIELIPEIKIVTEPQLNVLGLQTTLKTNISTKQLDNLLRKKGWNLGYFKQWDLLRVVSMPHVKREHLDNFLIDLKIILNVK